MWKLFKAEIGYNKILLTVLLLFFVIVNIMFLISGIYEPDKSYPALKAVFVSLMSVAWLSDYIKHQKEKTNRQRGILPVSLIQLSLIRNVYIPIIWMFIFITFWSTIILFRCGYIHKIQIIDLIAISGFVFTLNAVPIIYHNLQTILKNRFMKIMINFMYYIILILIMYTFLMMVVVLHASEHLDFLLPVQDKVKNYIYSSEGSIVFLLFGMLMICLGTFTYLKRKSYLE